MKRILGLDLGTTSIGWALINETENDKEKSSIIKTGVRVIPLSTDESNDFAKGKAATINADRTLKRGARRSLQRYKLRRVELIKLLKENKLITDNSILAEEGKESTHTLWGLRAKAATEEISLTNFARILLAINKKRGYKSNRKAKGDDEGVAIDGMDVANVLYEKQITPGQYAYDLLIQDKKHIPDFYRSDLQDEFDNVWKFQEQFYPDILTKKLKEEVRDKKKGHTYKICEKPFELVGIKRDTKGKELKLENYKWRVNGLNQQLTLEQLVVVFQEINNQLSNSSGYLGEISDRSKKLIIEELTVGQYLYEQIKENPHTRLKNQVFYRQDYLNEFNRIWETQEKFHSELTDTLKKGISDVVIFYQRRLKSQKGLISICELEGREIEIEVDGKPKKKTVGPKVIPKSSPLFQEYKIWSILNNLKFTELKTKIIFEVHQLDEDLEIRKQMFEVLNIKGKMSSSEILKAVFDKPKEWELSNYKEIEGNNTNQVLYKAYKNILELAGYEKVDFNDRNTVSEILESLGIKKEILDFDAELKGKEFEQQASYQLWHLLYSYEGDNSNTGNDKLYFHLKEKFGIEKEYANALVNVSFQDDYGSLSAKAIKKIIPYLKAGNDYSEACALAGYNHSHSLTKEQNDKRELKEVLELLPKNSLRNPVVEKILNQMVNVINAIIKEHGKPDEIRIELARELKKSAKERAEMTSHINTANKIHNGIREKLKNEFPPFNKGVRVTKNDIIRYKLWLETDKTSVYTGKLIKGSDLFTKDYDIEHIIPKAVLFDDSFSNKTLCERELNREKSSLTAYDYLLGKHGEETNKFNTYLQRIEKLFKSKKITKAKYNKLLMKGTEIPDGFIERDLRNTQYISKKAKEMLHEVFRTVTPITGIVTSKLRDDWQLINVMQELNWDKYDKLGLTKYETNKLGQKIPRIVDWTKRNDHRHHAMDALTVAFTKHNHIQYYNFLNARKDEKHKEYAKIVKIEKSIIETVEDKKGNKKRLMKPPMPINEFRVAAKKHLENTLISFKAKNKVVTRNKNKSKKKVGYNTQDTLTPRGRLHEDTYYSKSQYDEPKFEKVGTKFDEGKINLVAKKTYREVLLKRLKEFDNNPKKAFSGKNAPTKNPIYVNKSNTIELPEKIKLIYRKTQFTIRKDITPDLKIDKVIDRAAQRVLQKRLDEFNGDAKKAFVNLEENPIWLIEPIEKTEWKNINNPKPTELGIQLKRVRIKAFYQNLENSLQVKKDHFGNKILDKNGDSIPNNWVQTGNNHHVAIYRDKKGNLQEEVVSFYEAVMRKNEGVAIIFKNHPEHPEWEFLFTLKQNEYFIFPNEETGFNPDEIDLMNSNNYSKISPNLFRVQKISTRNYMFTHHLETQSITGEILKKKKQLSGITYNFIQTPEKLKGIIKVRINHIGQIVKIGEY